MLLICIQKSQRDAVKLNNYDKKLPRISFPWLENEMAKVEERGDQRNLSIVKRDRTALKFLRMLKKV